MKAFVISAPGEFRFEDRPEPSLADGQALLRIRGVSLCGTDLSTFRGKNPLVSYPRIPGHEIAAVIEDVKGGETANMFKGMPVTVSPYSNCGRCASCLRNRPNACQFNETFGVQRDGAMTELLPVPLSRIIVAEGLDPRYLSLVEPLSIGAHAAARGRVAPQDTVAVFGVGGVGLGAVAAAAFRGARVIAVDVDDSKLALARSAGAAHTVNTAVAPLHESLLELTNGLGPDVVIEAIGLPKTFRAAVDEVAWTGRVVYIGYSKEPVSYETRWFVQKELDILGSRNALPEDFRQVIAMLTQGRFPVESAISHTVPFASAGQAFSDWSSRPTEFKKILVEVSS